MDSSKDYISFGVQMHLLTEGKSTLDPGLHYFVFKLAGQMIHLKAIFKSTVSIWGAYLSSHGLLSSCLVTKLDWVSLYSSFWS